MKTFKETIEDQEWKECQAKMVEGQIKLDNLAAAIMFDMPVVNNVYVGNEDG